MAAPSPNDFWYTAPTSGSSILRYLNTQEKQYNVQRLYGFFMWPTLEGGKWTLNALAGMLGNMEIESHFDPALWENRSIPSNIYTAEKGFGLTQWTPGRKYIEWWDNNHTSMNLGSSYINGYAECMRINWERLNNAQWIKNENMSWDEFVKSTDTPERLSRVFCRNYERPGDPDYAQRASYARQWYDFLLENPGPPDDPLPPYIGDVPVYVLLAKKRRNKGRLIIRGC